MRKMRLPDVQQPGEGLTATKWQCGLGAGSVCPRAFCWDSGRGMRDCSEEAAMCREGRRQVAGRRDWSPQGKGGSECCRDAPCGLGVLQGICDGAARTAQKGPSPSGRGGQATMSKSLCKRSIFLLTSILGRLDKPTSGGGRSHFEDVGSPPREFPG